jgi:hypothetical protein
VRLGEALTRGAFLSITSGLVPPSMQGPQAPEDAVADDRVKQHQREDDDATPQEYERKTGLRRGGLVDGDDGGIM